MLELNVAQHSSCTTRERQSSCSTAGGGLNTRRARGAPAAAHTPSPHRLGRGGHHLATVRSTRCQRTGAATNAGYQRRAGEQRVTARRLPSQCSRALASTGSAADSSCATNRAREARLGTPAAVSALGGSGGQHAARLRRNAGLTAPSPSHCAQERGRRTQPGAAGRCARLGAEAASLAQAEALPRGRGPPRASRRASGRAAPGPEGRSRRAGTGGEGRPEGRS